ncbi:hypothetical protein LC1917_0002 [Lacticaseibacillus paracasei NRIC 1917]|uniref:Uncharacterized protein n=1 Tax=Lacticaseibacillus paracasei NRIC 0644 TaxID=1435038 RepID=A0A0C9QAX2_LACPA|nr:hypothetical protein LC0644_0367 [Lacticaseibacillus paracasei NRIC 0644]GAN38125.1 hypothetical protein LC1917_0002 [Lacticaseibacillus paracasei NRIC 1917]GAN40931.1 hypothetical protein LC1981_0150 [Lacticaseibacillus paracasei NRIC 1981]GEK40879.1 hypothetical protein LCA02_25690 [Lacticaseibacillus casei]
MVELEASEALDLELLSALTVFVDDFDELTIDCELARLEEERLDFVVFVLELESFCTCEVGTLFVDAATCHHQPPNPAIATTKTAMIQYLFFINIPLIG